MIPYGNFTKLGALEIGYMGNTIQKDKTNRVIGKTYFLIRKIMQIDISKMRFILLYSCTSYHTGLIFPYSLTHQPILY